MVYCHYKSISKQLLVATFKASVATCGEWRQGWTPLFYKMKNTLTALQTIRYFFSSQRLRRVEKCSTSYRAKKPHKLSNMR